MEHKNINVKLKVWRQKNAKEKGSFETYDANNISQEMSFLEMFDVLNEQLIRDGEDPVTFDHDCREGICGACSMYINGKPHGPWQANTTCQLHMRAFQDGDTIVVEPWRADAFPVIKDLMVDRSAFDRIIQAGGYISVNTGNAVDGNALPIEKDKADAAFSAAMCIGCGACVASCKNASEPSGNDDFQSTVPKLPSLSFNVICLYLSTLPFDTKSCERIPLPPSLNPPSY